MSDLSLTEFLLARIAETQAAAEGFHSRDCYLFVPNHMQADPPECDCGVPACVLADCEAKRRIVEEHPTRGGARPICVTCWSDYFMGHEDAPCRTLRFLALPYADHPDYREEWKP